MFHISGAMMAIVAVIATGVLVASPSLAADITVRQIRPSHYEFVLSNSTNLSETEAQAHIASAANAVCKDLVPMPGKYHYEGRETLGGSSTPDPQAFLFFQEVECVARASVAAIERHPTLRTPQESLRAESDIRLLSEAYFRYIANGQVDEAYSQLSAIVMGLDEHAWKSEKLTFRTTAGEPIQISIAKITIYDNPVAAPEPGLYVAADFSNVYKNVPIHCGYLMWFRPIGSTFRITREETGFVTADQLKSIPSSQRPELKRKLHCVTP